MHLAFIFGPVEYILPVYLQFPPYLPSQIHFLSKLSLLIGIPPTEEIDQYFSHGGILSQNTKGS
jgi:hypothetical protein